MAVIRISNLRLRAIIGANDWERDHKQDLIINVLSDFARHAGYRRIRLTTDNENVRALAFYDRLGFYRIDPFDGLPHDIYMERVLNDNDEDEN